jgi:hypothetical protein
MAILAQFRRLAIMRMRPTAPPLRFGAAGDAPPLGGGGASEHCREVRPPLLQAIAARDADAFEFAPNSVFRGDLPAALADVFAETLLM